MRNHYHFAFTALIMMNSLIAVSGLHARVKENECITVGGDRVGVPCIFPFVYDILDDVPYVPATIFRWLSTEKTFNNCTTYSKYTGRSWCATKTTSNGRYVPGHWGECPNSYSCNTVEGSYRPWSSWSQWTECAGGICGKAGLTNRTRTRIIFSRKSGAYFNCTGNENEEKQEQEKKCSMKECPGWTNKDCHGGVDIFRKNETFLIALIGDTKEKCEALCQAIPECNLARFHSMTTRKILKCIPKSAYDGHCKHRYKHEFFRKSDLESEQDRFYVKENRGSEGITRYNNLTEWRWNTLDSGSANDCRLCVSSRAKEVWDSCQKACTNVPNDLKDMKIFMKIAFQKFASVEAKWNYWLSQSQTTRQRLLQLLNDNKALFSFLMNGYE